MRRGQGRLTLSQVAISCFCFEMVVTVAQDGLELIGVLLLS